LTDATAAISAAETKRLTRRGLRLAQFTIAYNVVEGAIAITSGIGAGLVSLIGFGVDSGIESAVAILVSLRLASRLKRGEGDEVKERRALKLISLSFFALAAYVVFEGIRDLVAGERPDTSIVGLVLLTASIIVMPVLAGMKRKVGLRLRDNLILADAAETRICTLLSISTLLALGLFAITGAPWWDAAGGFVIALFAINEGREAWHGELAEDEH
jgi:divalent metal cation (Fe/Co/Zn/Cd) transporter